MVAAWSLGLFTVLWPQSSHTQSVEFTNRQKSPIGSSPNSASFDMDCSQAGSDETSLMLGSMDSFGNDSKNALKRRKKIFQGDR